MYIYVKYNIIHIFEGIYIRKCTPPLALRNKGINFLILNGDYHLIFNILKKIIN